MNTQPKAEPDRKVKNQHYVPQFYLRHFSINPNASRKERKIWVFDKKKPESRQNRIADVAHERYLYDLPRDIPLPDGTFLDVQVAEKFLSEMEGTLTPYLNDFLTYVETGRRMRRTDKETLSLLVALQHLRTRKARNHTARATERILEAISEQHLELVYGEKKHNVVCSISEERAAFFQISLLLNNSLLIDFCQKLMEHIWFIGVNQSSQPFYTSDCPVVMHSHWNDPRAWIGLLAPGIEIVLPISPRYMLVLLDRTFFSHLEQDEGDYFDYGLDIVNSQNALQVRGSRRFLFCDSNAFLLADEMCHQHPELREAEREVAELVPGFGVNRFAVRHRW